MKSVIAYIIGEGLTVAPRMGAWIEIWLAEPWEDTKLVAPRMGAWIEIAITALR